MNYRKILALFLTMGMVSVSVTGCGEKNNTAGNTDIAAETSEQSGTKTSEQSSADNSGESSESSAKLDTTDLFSDRDLDGSYDAENAIAISLQGNSASCDSNLVKIEGSTITITSEGVYILKGTLENGQIIVDADQSKVQLVLSGASVTCQSSAAVYVKQADKVFLTLDENTENTLSTSGEFVQTDDNTVDGVVFSKDDITVNGKGKLTVTTGNGHGIVSKDELTMTGGEVTIQASGHALSGKDSVCIAEGNYLLTAGTDGIHSDNEEDTAKGFIYIGGGTFQITSVSDGLDASGRLRIDHGTLTLNCDDDGIHADTALYIADGTIDVQKSNEGLESAMILIDGGTIHVVSSDDGLNASGGDGFQTDTGISLVINGGSLTVEAEGDGLDSNGSFSMTGGNVYVYGTQNGGNGALDLDREGVISGGYLVAVSCSTMESSFGDSSSQGSIATALSGTVTGELSLKDPDGNVLISCSPNKPYSTVQISCPELAAGKTYTLTAGSQTVEIVMDGLHYGAFSNGGGGGRNKGGMGGTMPERGSKGDRKPGMPGEKNPADGNSGSENGEQIPEPGLEPAGNEVGEL